ncbi:hypothetical protein [Deferrisoma camini]|uniref:hypothetical protein n=1 Tax=Deferrisoma camini TaxID=1035120 RepID=UPI00046D0587|nr:hypothetical protein [Deferrisoma camini]
MHRTQILLEETQYLALRERARREGKSIGQLIREFVDLGLSGAGGKGARERACLQKLAGLFGDGMDPRDHDRVLYRDP